MPNNVYQMSVISVTKSEAVSNEGDKAVLDHFIGCPFQYSYNIRSGPLLVQNVPLLKDRSCPFSGIGRLSLFRDRYIGCPCSGIGIRLYLSLFQCRICHRLPLIRCNPLPPGSTSPL